jgi:hypothetical protein
MQVIGLQRSYLKETPSLSAEVNKEVIHES